VTQLQTAENIPSSPSINAHKTSNLIIYFTFRMPCSSEISIQWLLRLVVDVAASGCQRTVWLDTCAAGAQLSVVADRSGCRSVTLSRNRQEPEMIDGVSALAPQVLPANILMMLLCVPTFLLLFSQCCFVYKIVSGGGKWNKLNNYLMSQMSHTSSFRLSNPVMTYNVKMT